MTLVCQYSIARFLPYVETGEFANFGVVLYCPETGYFGFKLLKRRVGRITAFFEELEPAIYRRAWQTLEDELERLKKIVVERRNHAAPTGDRFLTELTRSRESIVRFGETRAIMTDDPAAEVDELFKHYVERSFVTPEYHDRIAEKAVRNVLTRAGVQKEYAPLRFAAGGYHAQFPFVRRRDNRVVQVIKPLYLAHSDAAQIFNHGWNWVGRIKRLQELNELPERILLPIKGPKGDDPDRHRQFEAAQAALATTKATIVPLEDEAEIRRFVAG